MTDSARDPLEEADVVEQIAPIEGADSTVDPQRSSEDGSVEDATVDIDPDVQVSGERPSDSAAASGQHNPAAQPDAEPASDVQPETQGEDPLHADLGETGQGDLAPEDEA